MAHVTALPSRPPSPWPGSSHAEGYRWQLDDVRNLPEAATALRALAAELRAAHAAGWTLLEPVERGHLVALVRTTEVLAFGHGADGARDLPAAAAALERLARAADAMAAGGGRLQAVDGFLVEAYGPP